MRFPIGLLTAGLVAGQMLVAPLAAAAECMRPADHASFDVAALKSNLMVTALTCDAGERYNAFIRKYQPELASHERTLNGYFSRANGRNARKQQDDYVTQLANSRSQEGTKQGSLYCNNNLPAFDEVMALRSSSELADYAAGKAGAQPISVAACGSAPAATTRSATVRPAAARSSGHTSSTHARRG